MQVGIDIVHIPEFSKRFSSQAEIDVVFTGDELSNNPRVENKAGIFAAKEACMKALGKKIDWHDIRIIKQEQGKPSITCACVADNDAMQVSISHDGDYAIAIVIIKV